MVTLRASGVLMPVSALPSAYGIGGAGGEAERFAQFLEKAGQRLWQVLPLGPTGYGDSPYQSFSAFAGNPYFIDLEALAAEGLLTPAELSAERACGGGERVDYATLFARRLPLLRRGAARVEGEPPGFARFERENEGWLADYALFMALKTENGQEPFELWEESLRRREPEAMERARARLAEEIRFWKLTQFWFDTQWKSLRAFANGRGVRIIGDVPIYAARDSADLWAHPELFQTDGDGALTAAAGCPPDAFSPDGQLWGSPLYDWEQHRKTGYAWWLSRLRRTAQLCDMARLDHFRGFAGYYSIPAGEPTAKNGHWEPGPGLELIDAIKRGLPELPIIAEDLGFLTDDVRELLAASGFPGMSVLQFAFSPDGGSDYLPHKHRPNSVVYTGTHDNATLLEWAREAPEAERRFAREYTGAADDAELACALMRTALSSVCDTAVIPMADWLGLGAEGRINRPATMGGNWAWRMEPGALTDALAASMRRAAEIYGR